MWVAELPPLEGLANDYRLLINEVVRLLLGDQLFRFVTAKPKQQPNGTTKPVDGTNNEAERTLRVPPSASDRSDEQDAPRCPPPDDFDERPGITSSLSADFHAFDRAR